MSLIEISLLFFVASLAGWYSGEMLKRLFGKKPRSEQPSEK